MILISEGCSNQEIATQLALAVIPICLLVYTI